MFDCVRYEGLTFGVVAMSQVVSWTNDTLMMLCQTLASIPTYSIITARQAPFRNSHDEAERDGQ